MLIAEPLAGPANAADDLVDVQQNPVTLADVLHALPVTFGRRDDAAASGHGLQADRADRVWPFPQDHFLDGVGGAFAIVRNVAVLAAIFQAMRNFDEPRGQGAVLGASLRLPAGR